ncbi:MAG: O-antigen ligase family protein [Desulfobacteraceae bacterium]|nr:MAG: O-antigen ligase family protein [Desulfobacteraceae bacterium]
MAFATLKVLPLGEKNALFLFALPVAALFFLLVIVDVKFALILLLFSRASLDYALELTRVNILGQNIGLGGAINLSVLLLVSALVVQRPEAFVKNPVGKRWIAYLLICSVAILYSPVPGRGVRLFLNLLSYYCMLTIPFILIDRIEDQKFWLKVLLFSTILPVCLANLDLIRGGTEFHDAGTRLQGSFPHPNILAFYLVFAVALVFYTLQSELFSLSATKRNILRIYLLDLLILLVATKSRNGWLACWGLFLLYGMLKDRRCLLLSLIVPLPALLVPSIRDRILDVFGSYDLADTENLNSFAWRLRLWKDSLLTLKKTFLFGNGLSSFEFLVEGFSEWDERFGAHNTYLEVLVETGLLGIVAYVGIYYGLLKSFLAKMRKTAGPLSSGYAILFCYAGSYAVVCLGDNMLYYLSFNWYFWFFMGVMTRCAHLEI